ncbi:unnamed protein product, partial [Rotaria magnacalcarata]
HPVNNNTITTTLEIAIINISINQLPLDVDLPDVFEGFIKAWRISVE